MAEEQIPSGIHPLPAHGTQHTIVPYPPASTLFRHTTHKTLVMSSNIERSRVQDTVSNSDDDEDYSTLSSPSSREHQISEAKRAYVSENSKKQLYLLCIGIKDDDGAAIFDLEMQPWKSLKKKTSSHPEASMQRKSFGVRRDYLTSPRSPRQPTGLLPSASNGCRATQSTTTTIYCFSRMKFQGCDASSCMQNRIGRRHLDSNRVHLPGEAHSHTCG